MGCRSSQKKFQRYRPKIDVQGKIFVFDPIYKGKRAKISPKVNKIEIWPISRPKVINSCTVDATVDCSQGGGDLVVDCAH